MRSWRGSAGVLLMALAACNPALNWRETRPEGSTVTLLFPCRGDHRERRVRFAGADLPMQMHSCAAAGITFSLGFIDAPEPSRVTPLLEEMRAAAVANVGGAAAARPLEIPGATPNARSALVRIEGRLPDGRHVVEQAAFFVHGLRLYQATAFGESLDVEAAQTFFGSIKVVT